MNSKYLLIILLSLFLSYLIYVRFIKKNNNENFYYNASNDIVYSDSNGNLISVNKTSIINDTIDAILTKDFVFKKGMIIAWSGDVINSPIPPGWAVCDGKNGTPDLRGRFILGYNDGATYGNTDKNSGLSKPRINSIGGSETHRLTIEEIPSHSHSNIPAPADNCFRGGDCSGDRTHVSGTRNSGTEGGGAAHNNMPPYYVLAYIMKL